MIFPIKTCVIIRGLSGSGKSTLARNLTSFHKNVSTAIHETDTYFYDSEGNYNIDFSKMGEYHQANFEAFCQSIRDGIHLVIQSNTNTQLWEFNHYVEFATQNGYAISIIDLYDGGLDNNQLHARQVHDFPIEKYDVVRKHYERSYANLDPRKPWERG